MFVGRDDNVTLSQRERERERERERLLLQQRERERYYNRDITTDEEKLCS